MRRLLGALLGISAGCIPDLDDRASLVTAQRVLAVRADPAEALPGQPVSYTALVAAPLGASTELALEWAFCTDPVPLDRLEPVSPRCLSPSAPWLLPLGVGTTVAGQLPSDACRRFGPTPPDPPPGQPAARPVDPDSTGGYYQPLRALLPAALQTADLLSRSRVRCGIAGAAQEQAAEFTQRYQPNRNPVLGGLALLGSDGSGAVVEIPADGAGSPPQIPPGRSVRLRVRWSGDDAEQYVLFDPAQRAIVSRRETLTLSWFATAGIYADGRTGGGGEAAAPSESDNGWSAPEAPGEVLLWVVLRDERGGVGWQRYRLTVGP